MVVSISPIGFKRNRFPYATLSAETGLLTQLGWMSERCFLLGPRSRSKSD